ncbi:MAG: radical SAM protein [Candidatus Heimdallarchaeaceae archaeon]
MQAKKDNLYIFSHKNTFFIFEPQTRLFWHVNYLESNIYDQVYSLYQLKEVLEYSNSEESKRIWRDLQTLQKRGFFTYDDDNNKEKRQDKFSIDFIVINPTNNCNLDCWYCYASPLRKGEKTELSVQKVKEVIRFFSEYKKKIQSSTSLGITLFYTGEVTLDFPFFQAIHSFVKELNEEYEFEIYLFLPATNFIRPSPEFISFVNKYRFLTVSIDLSRDDNIDIVLKNLALIEKNVKTHCIIPIHSKIRNIKSIYDYFSDYFNIVSLRPVRVTPSSAIPWTPKSLKSFISELENFVEQLLELEEEELHDFLLKLAPTDYFLRYLHRLISRDKQIIRCPAGSTALVLDSKGEIYPCSGLIGNQNYKIAKWSKNARVEDFILNAIRKVDTIAECQNCPIRYVCGGPCIDWLERQFPNKIKETNDYECTINQTLAKILIYFIYQVNRKYPLFFSKYTKKRKIKNKVNYPLELSSFSKFFT